MAEIRIEDINQAGIIISSNKDYPKTFSEQSLNYCKYFIQHFMTPSKKKSYNSYHLKHVVERWCGHYIANGEFIAAAIYMKLVMEPYNIFKSPNVAVQLKYKNRKFRRYFEYGITE